MSGPPASTRTVSESARPVGRRARTASDEQRARSLPPRSDV